MNKDFVDFNRYDSFQAGNIRRQHNDAESVSTSTNPSKIFANDDHRYSSKILDNIALF